MGVPEQLLKVKGMRFIRARKCPDQLVANFFFCSFSVTQIVTTSFNKQHWVYIGIQYLKRSPSGRKDKTTVQHRIHLQLSKKQARLEAMLGFLESGDFERGKIYLQSHCQEKSSQLLPNSFKTSLLADSYRTK